MEVEMLIDNLFVRPEEVKSTPQRHEARALSHATAIPQFTGDLRAIAPHNNPARASAPTSPDQQSEKFMDAPDRSLNSGG